MYLIREIEKAIDDFDGLSWDTAASEMLANVQKGRHPYSDTNDGTWWGAPADREWFAGVRREIDDLERDAAIELAEEAVRREAVAVERAAERAARYARRAVKALQAGDLPEAAAQIAEAADIEREFGDAPAYGEIAETIADLAERAVPEAEAWALYDEMLDETGGTLTIGTLVFPASRVLRELDPVAYDCGFGDEWANVCGVWYVQSNV
jgi:hypothetical protein